MLHRPATSAEYVRSQLRRAILDQEYKSGQRLDQDEIARSLNVSLIPLREGLRMLAAEGFVTITPRRGVHVAELTRDSLVELYRIRQALEPLAIELAIPHMTSQDLHEVEAVESQFEQAVAKRDYAESLLINQGLHVLLFSPAKQPLLLEMISNLALRSACFRQLLTAIPQQAEHAVKDHQAIIAACRDRDIPRAKTLTADHLHHTVEGVMRFI